jgi:C4-dicarboxylate transporter DctM subunit
MIKLGVIFNMGIFLIICLFALIAVNMPIGFAIGISSAATLIFSYHKPLLLIPQRMVIGTDKFALMAIPFFILIGVLMEKSKISKSLIELATKLVGHITGGLSIVVVLASMFFAAISGSGPATVAAIGSITIPEMEKGGYSKKFATGIAASAGALGPIIPPSIPMIIYGVTAEESITKLFLGGFGAGFLLATIMIIICYFKARKEKVPRVKYVHSIKDIFMGIWQAKYAIGAPLIVLGGIYGGIFTPTEAGAIGSVYTIIIGFLFTRTLNLKKLMEAFLKTAELSAVIMFIIANAALFGWLMTSGGVPQTISRFILSISDNKIILLILINIILLITGALMDTVAAIIILVPVFLPIANQLGIDPIHFGIIVVVNLVIGYLTPPVGYNLYIAGPIAGLSFEETSSAVLIFLFGAIIGLILITYIPGIALFFPRLFA